VTTPESSSDPGGGRSSDPAERCEDPTGAELTGRCSTFGFGRTVGPTAPPLAPGAIIGACRIERLIGRGGMGWVYEARQQKPDRLVAVKVLQGAGIDPDATSQFESETTALASLRHPGIAHVYTAGVDDGGLPYLVMELIPEGLSITAHADAAGLPVRQRVDLFVGVCEAAAHAHQRGVVHRDIKPGNILVERGGAVKLIDFGIAIGPSTAPDAAATPRRDRYAGTPQYMSPEQFQAAWHELDPRSDVYSLGLVLYELVSGGRPYAVDSTRITEAERVVSTSPPRPLPATIDRPLARVILKCLEKAAGRRYPDAAALAADLRRYLNGDEVLAAPEPLWEAVGRLARRHRAVATAAVIALLSLAVAATGMSVFALRARRAEEAARQEAARARDQARATQQLADYHESQFELGNGRVRRAFALATRAFESGPAWEYGRQIGAIVDSARSGWHLVGRIDVAASPVWIAFARGSRACVVLGFTDRVEVHRLGVDGPVATAAIAGSSLPCPLDRDALAAVVPGTGIQIVTLPGLEVTATCAMPGDVTVLRASGDGTRLAALTSAGEAAVFDREGRKVAGRTFRGASRSGTPGLAVSPSGRRLVWHSGIWSEPKVRWDVDTDDLRTFSLPVHDLAFESENSLVGIWSPASLGDRIRLLRFDVDQDREPEGNAFGAIGVRYRQGATLECVFDAASGETGVALVAPDSVSRVWMTPLDGVPASRPLIVMPLPDDGYGFSRVHAVLGEALWPHVSDPVVIHAHDAGSETLALTAGRAVLVFAATPGRLAGSDGAPLSALASRACGTSYWTFHATGREAIACSGNELVLVSLVSGERRTLAIEPPPPAPGREFMAWGVTATPDGRTIAILWQEAEGGGHVGARFHRKIAGIYRLDSDRRRSLPPTFVPLTGFDGVNGRLNREFALAPDGEIIAFAPASGKVVGYRVSDGTQRYSFAAGTTFATHSPTGLFAGGRTDRADVFRVHDLHDGRLVGEWPLEAPVTKAQFAPDGRTIYIGLEPGSLRQHRVADGRLVSQLETPLAPFAISHRGDRFVGRAEDTAAPSAAGWTPGSLVVADLSTGRAVATLAATAHPLNRAAFGPDDSWIASVTERTVVRFTAALDPRRAAKLLETIVPDPNSSQDP